MKKSDLIRLKSQFRRICKNFLIDFQIKILVIVSYSHLLFLVLPACGPSKIWHQATPRQLNCSRPRRHRSNSPPCAADDYRARTPRKSTDCMSGRSIAASPGGFRRKRRSGRRSDSSRVNSRRRCSGKGWAARPAALEPRSGADGVRCADCDDDCRSRCCDDGRCTYCD